MVMPPSTEYTFPVANADSSEARNTTTGAISSAFASRPIGWRAMNALRASTGSAWALIRSWSDGVAADTLGHEVRGNRLGQSDDGGLARTVNETVRNAFDRTGDRRHVDDAAAAVGEHGRQRAFDRHVHRANVEF